MFLLESYLLSPACVRDVGPSTAPKPRVGVGGWRRSTTSRRLSTSRWSWRARAVDYRGFPPCVPAPRVLKVAPGDSQPLGFHRWRKFELMLARPNGINEHVSPHAVGENMALNDDDNFKQLVLANTREWNGFWFWRDKPVGERGCDEHQVPRISSRH